MTRPGVGQAGEQVGFTCSLQGLLDLRNRPFRYSSTTVHVFMANDTEDLGA